MCQWQEETLNGEMVLSHANSVYSIHTAMYNVIYSHFIVTLKIVKLEIRHKMEKSTS